MIPKYTVIIRWNGEDEQWIAHCRELATVAGDGPTPVYALKDFEIALAEWLASAKDHNWLVPSPMD